MPREPLAMSDRPKDWNESDEARFKPWYATVSRRYDLDPNPDAPEHAYNYRHAFKAGAWPDQDAHWPSEFKAANHPNRYVDGQDTATGRPMSQGQIEIEVEGHGIFEFPDDTPESVIQDTVRRLTQPSDSKGVASQFADQFKANMGVGADMAIGAAKGVGNTVFGLGKMVRDYTPVGRISDAILPGAFDQRPSELAPTNTAQRVGFTGEQLGEFFLPTGAAGKLGKVAEAAKAGGLTLAQTGSPAGAGASAVLSAAIPPVAAAAARQAGQASERLSRSAVQSMTRSLAPTKEWAKAETAKLAPEMLRRGVGGSRQAMLTQAKANAKAIGSDIDDAYSAAAAQGATIPGTSVLNELRAARAGYLVPDRTNKLIPIPGAEPVVERLSKLEDFVAQLGNDIPVDRAQHVKKVWDKIVAKKGLYGPKAAASATDDAMGYTIREGAGSFRQQLAQAVPDAKALNADYAFWKGLKDVLKATDQRKIGQTQGLYAAMAGTTGAAVGLAEGGIAGAFAGGQIGRQFVRLMQSPYWQSKISAPLKDRMANALASGNKGLATATFKNMLVALPAQARPEFAR